METELASGPMAPVNIFPERRLWERILAPLNQIAENSCHFLSKSFGQFESEGQIYSLPRYVYLGPKGGVGR